MDALKNNAITMLVVGIILIILGIIGIVYYYSYPDSNSIFYFGVLFLILGILSLITAGILYYLLISHLWGPGLMPGS